VDFGFGKDTFEFVEVMLQWGLQLSLMMLNSQTLEVWLQYRVPPAVSWG